MITSNTANNTGLRFRGLLTVGLLLLVTGCPSVQVGGPVTQATLTITPLNDPSDTIERLQTADMDTVIEEVGTEEWDEYNDVFRLLSLGNVEPDASLYDADTLYLVTAEGGRDHDPESDRVMNEEPVEVNGQWHALLTGAQIEKSFRVSPLTEAVYRYLEFNLDALSDEDIIAEMDRLAALMMVDADLSGEVDYDDVLVWSRLLNRRKYALDLANVDAMAAGILAGASVADLQSLSLAVLGLPEGGNGPFTLSGSISVSSATAVDGDVNDPNTEIPRAANDSRETAQNIGNPVTVGGYVNLDFEGEEGANFDAGDFDDYYRVNLSPGQQVTLVMADKDPDPEAPELFASDLDLFVEHATDALEPLGSFGETDVEQVTLPEDYPAGTYIVRVNAFWGASNYQLSVGISGLAAPAETIRLSDDFVPGQLVARFREHPDVDSMDKRARFTGMRVRGGLRRANLLEMSDAPGADMRRYARKLRTIYAMKRLRRQAQVESVGLNYMLKPMAVPNDPLYSQQAWHYEMINLPAAWDRSLGENVTVAVVDTGIRSRHPDMRNRLVDGYDFISDPLIAGDGDGIDPDPEDPGDAPGTGRSSFHGTHVSGTIAAASNNSEGVAGVAWNANIMPLRALGIGGGTTYDVIQAVRYAAGLNNDSGGIALPPADVINLSLGGGGYDVGDQAVFNLVANQGIIVVAAAGNESSSRLSYPASYDNVISVSAVNINRERAPYSNFGSAIDVAAPGGDALTPDANGDGNPDMVLSTSADDSVGPITDSYEYLQGTSMAAPHVTGVVALMKAIHPPLNVNNFQAALEGGEITDDLGAAGRDNSFGWGLINANKAVLLAEGLANGGEIPVQPQLAASAIALNFGATASALPLTLSNGGTGDLSVADISSSEPWLSIVTSEVDASGQGLYTIEVDRSQLAVGSYRATVSVQSNGGALDINVILRQPDPDAVISGDAGLHYILLLNAETGEVYAEEIALAVEGRYDFTFTDIPAGSYQLIGGGDADNDGFICDPGEACGAWPVLDSQLMSFEVFQDLTGLNFSSSFNAGIISGADTGSADPRVRPQRRPR